MECTICRGNKVQNLTVTTLGIEGSKTLEIECVACGGTGEISGEMASAINYMEDAWCDCEDDHGVTFLKDGEHPEIHKHHYRCKSCKKIVQIG